MNQQHRGMTMGQDVTDAYNKMEKLKHTARVVPAARLQGPLPPLPEAEVEKLRRLGEKYKGGDDVGAGQRTRFIVPKLYLRMPYKEPSNKYYTYCR